MQARLEGAVVVIKATTMASRNKNKPARKRVLRKKALKARGEFEARMGALPRGKVVKKPVVTKLWVDGRATEDRVEWCEEVRLRCYD